MRDLEEVKSVVAERERIRLTFCPTRETGPFPPLPPSPDVRWAKGPFPPLPPSPDVRWAKGPFPPLPPSPD
eukprot:gene26871-47343_t